MGALIELVMEPDKNGNVTLFLQPTGILSEFLSKELTERNVAPDFRESLKYPRYQAGVRSVFRDMRLLREKYANQTLGVIPAEHARILCDNPISITNPPRFEPYMEQHFSNVSDPEMYTDLEDALLRIRIIRRMAVTCALFASAFWPGLEELQQAGRAEETLGWEDGDPTITIPVPAG